MVAPDPSSVVGLTVRHTGPNRRHARAALQCGCGSLVELEVVLCDRDGDNIDARASAFAVVGSDATRVLLDVVNAHGVMVGRTVHVHSDADVASAPAPAPSVLLAEQRAQQKAEDREYAAERLVDAVRRLRTMDFPD